jgi:Tol biopolymer transport system component
MGGILWGLGRVTPVRADDNLTIHDVGTFEIPAQVTPTLVTIAGPTLGFVDTTYTFTATVDPISTTIPVTYTWDATGQSPVTNTGGISDSVIYAWTLPGSQVLTVTASNLYGLITDTHTISITDVSVSGSVAVNDSPTELGSATTLSATISAGTNVSYIWDFGDEAFGSGEVITHTYPITGVFTATVTASNSANTLTATTVVTVTEPTEYVYLPTVQKNKILENAQIAFTSNRDGNWEIYLMMADGRSLTNLTNNLAWDGEFVWSPDGSKIAFTSDRNGGGDIYVMNADGTGVTNLTNNPQAEHGLAWSPDGSKIAFVSYLDPAYEIYVINVDGTNQVRLTDPPYSDWSPTWSPDGSKICFLSGRDQINEIYIMNPDGSDQTNLTNNQDGELFPTWSPDGSKIAFTSTRDGDDDVFVMNADGTNPINLTNNTVYDENPTWSPDGSRIAFFSDRDGDYAPDSLLYINADGTGETTLTDQVSLYVGTISPPYWSPDGSRIVFVSLPDMNKEIYIINADGTGMTNLTNNTARDDYPAWRPQP